MFIYAFKIAAVFGIYARCYSSFVYRIVSCWKSPVSMDRVGFLFSYTSIVVCVQWLIGYFFDKVAIIVICVWIVHEPRLFIILLTWSQNDQVMSSMQVDQTRSASLSL